MVRAFLILSCLMNSAGVLWQDDSATTPPHSDQYFAIQVVDRETGRGVPLIELKTVNGIVQVTDSQGWVAFHEPGLMDREVYFHVAGHGYEMAADGFGYRGVRLTTQPGGRARIEVSRTNVAERLYRLTGQGIYRDSSLLGEAVPIDRPNLNGGVLGQDSVQAAVFDGRIYWFWGDTNRAAYPLGQFKTSGAVSQLPDAGGLNPHAGVNLTYFVDAHGFSRPLAPLEGPGVVWLDGLFVLPESPGEQMIAHFSRRKSLTEEIEHGLVVWNRDGEAFEKRIVFDNGERLFPRGQAFLVDQRDGPYVYFATPFPTVRVKADWSSIADPTSYEAFTCLEAESELDAAHPRIERDRDGRVVWDWKANTPAISPKDEMAWVRAGLLAESDRRLLIGGEADIDLDNVADDDTARRVWLHSGSVHWNEFRGRYVMIGLQAGGECSFLGDLWYAEADRLEGPWINARRIVTHQHYSFYNPAHHPFFDQDGGRVIYFQGTYTSTFSKAKARTPRYDYNQIMYRLDLGSRRLGLPSIAERH